MVERRPEPAKDHPWLLIEKKGVARPTVALLKDVAEAVSRPFVDSFLKELRRRLRDAQAIEETEEITFLHNLDIAGRGISAHYLDVVLSHGPRGSVLRGSGPVARIDLLRQKVDWYRMHRGGYAYEEVAAHPDLFLFTLEKTLWEMFGFPPLRFPLADQEGSV